MDRFESPISKLDWAYEHLTTLDLKFRDFRDANPYKGVIESHPEFGQAVRFQVSSLPPLPKEFSHRIGEFATALRASMDHLIWALMTGAPKKTNKIQFPIFNTSGDYRSAWPQQLSGVVSAAEPIINSLQPYHVPQPHAHPLWRIHRLSNTDKHRVIILAPYAARLSFGPLVGERAALTMAFKNPSEDPIIPLPPSLIEVGRHFNLQIEAALAVVLQNADTDTGIFMSLEELPTLYQFVRDKVFPPLKALFP